MLKQRVKTYWDYATLGPLKWYLLGVYFVGWVGTKTLVFGVGVKPNTHPWAYTISPLIGNESEFWYWCWLWISGSVYSPLGFVVAGVTAFLLVMAYLRGQ